MKNDGESHIVSSGSQRLARYSSDLSKRGLSLANQIQLSHTEPSQPPQELINQTSIEDLTLHHVNALFLRGIYYYQLGNKQIAIEYLVLLNVEMNRWVVVILAAP